MAKKIVYFENPEEHPFPGINKKILKLTKKLRIIKKKEENISSEIEKMQNSHEHIFYLTGNNVNLDIPTASFVCVCGIKTEI